MWGFFPHQTILWHQLSVLQFNSILTLFTWHVCLVTQSCTTLCDPLDYSPPGSSVHEISQARILERSVMPFSRGSSWSRDQTHVSCVSCIASGFFTCWAIREAPRFTWIYWIYLEVASSPPKNWCFWTVVLEKTLESPLDCKEIQPVHPKGDQS